MLFYLLVAALNFALGFALAVHLGHGPPGIDAASVIRLLHTLRARLRGRSRAGGH